MWAHSRAEILGELPLRQGAMGTNWGTGSSIWTWGRTSSLWGWRSTGTGWPGGLWILLLWRYSRPTWTPSCAACCRWPCFGRRVRLDDPQRSLPTPTILWFCIFIYFFTFFELATRGSQQYLNANPTPSPQQTQDTAWKTAAWTERILKLPESFFLSCVSGKLGSLAQV